MSKNIIVVIGTCSPGGIYTVINQHLDLLEDTSYETIFIPTHSEGSGLVNIMFFLKAYFVLLYTLSRSKVSGSNVIIHSHVSMRGSVVRKYFCLLLAKIFHIKYFLHLHGSEIKVYVEGVSGFTKYTLFYLFRNSSGVIVLAESWKKYIDLKFGIESFVLPNFIKQESSDNKVFEAINNKQSQHVFSFFGALIDRKGCSIAIQAFSNLIKSQSISCEDFKFKIYGEGSLRKELEELVDSCNLNKAISFEGWVVGEEKQTSLLSTDTLILPSKNEGLPMVIIEAKSTGCALISTDVGAINSMILEGQGCLVSANSVQEIEESILILMRAGDDLKKIKYNNFEDYLARYTPAACSEILLRIYEC